MKSNSIKARNKQGKKPVRILLITFSSIVILFLFAFWFFTNCRFGLFKLTNPYNIGEAVAPENLKMTVDNKRYSYNNDVINILALGTDPVQNIDNPVFAGQADTLLLFSINVKTNKIRMLPIPRDIVTSIARIDAFGEIAHLESDFICKSYAFGYGGIVSGQLTQAATSNLLYGIPIHRFGSINITAIKPITDFVGGVPVQVDHDFEMVAGIAAGETLLLNGGNWQKLMCESAAYC